MAVVQLGARSLFGVQDVADLHEPFRLAAVCDGEMQWRLSFVLGMVAAPWLYQAVVGSFEFESPRGTVALVVAGLLVGYGTRLGSGCTSGHGVCGLSRLSLRSLIATGVFMVTGFVVASVLMHVI